MNIQSPISCSSSCPSLCSSLWATILCLAFCFALPAAVLGQEVGPVQRKTKPDLSAEEIAKDYETIELRRWTLFLNRHLKSEQPQLCETMLQLMDLQLKRVIDAVPPIALKHLRSVPIWVNPTYEGVRPTAEYHPNASWLRKNGRLTEMARCIEITNVANFEFENTRMPYLMLHELAHAYHDQVLNFSNPKIRLAFDAAEASGGYNQVDRFTGRKIVKDKAYAMSNHKEYFAESTEAFFGKNDFFPFNREELQEHDPGMVDVLKEVWGIAKQEPADAKWRLLFDGKTLENWEAIEFGGEGEVSIIEGAIHLESGDPLTGIRVVEDLELPSSNYELTFEAIKYEGNDFFAALTFPVGKSFCTLVLGGWGGTLVGLSNLDGEDASLNPTSLRMKFDSDHWYSIRLRVSDDEITAWVDDKKVVDQSIKGVEVSIRNDVIVTTPLGITSFMTVSGIRNIRIRELDEPNGAFEPASR